MVDMICGDVATRQLRGYRLSQSSRATVRSPHSPLLDGRGSYIIGRGLQRGSHRTHTCIRSHFECSGVNQSNKLTL